jgi:hypothetical protein
MTASQYLHLWFLARPSRCRWGDRGEGVISAAIAVLVMAFLGVAMWVGLRSIWDTAEENTSDQVEEIGK